MERLLHLKQESKQESTALRISAAPNARHSMEMKRNSSAAAHSMPIAVPACFVFRLHPGAAEIRHGPKRFHKLQTLRPVSGRPKPFVPTPAALAPLPRSPQSRCPPLPPHSASLLPLSLPVPVPVPPSLSHGPPRPLPSSLLLVPLPPLLNVSRSLSFSLLSLSLSFKSGIARLLSRTPACARCSKSS